MDNNVENANHGANFTQNRVIRWKIPEFEFLSQNGINSLDSPLFFMQNAIWCLRVYPKPESEDEEELFVGLTIRRLQSLLPRHSLCYKLSWDGNDESRPSVAVDFDEDNKEHGDMNLIDRSDVEMWFPNGVVTFICELSDGSPANALFEVEYFMRTTKEFQSFCQSMKDAFKVGQNHDLVLNVQGKEFRAHKDILRARSPVFQAMLSHDMIEKRRGVVDIPDCDPEVFHQFLLYLYSAEVETLDAGNVLALYHTAHKYDVQHLKEKCLEFIKKLSSPSNITSIIQYALNYNDFNLLECASDYFAGDIKLILPTVEWQEFIHSNGTKANQILIKVAEKLIKKGMK